MNANTHTNMSLFSNTLKITYTQKQGYQHTIIYTLNDKVVIAPEQLSRKLTNTTAEYGLGVFESRSSSFYRDSVGVHVQWPSYAEFKESVEQPGLTNAKLLGKYLTLKVNLVYDAFNEKYPEENSTVTLCF